MTIRSGCTDTKSLTEGVTVRTVYANDRLLTETLDHADSAEDRHTVYTYDATEQATKTVHEGLDDTGTVTSQTTYSYNLQGRMAKVEIDADGDGQTDTTIEYAYNDHGIRVKQSVTEGGQTVTHEYVINNSNHTSHAQVLEESIDGQLVNTFTIGHTILAQHDPTNGTLTFLVDGHNSTMALVNELAELVQRFAYDAYGNMLEGAGLTPASAALTAHLYAGEQFDAKLGMQYLRARYYDPSIGTFNRLDPWAGNIRDPQSLHKYLYTHANPVMNVDPTGLLSFSNISIATAIRVSLQAIRLYSPLALRDAVSGVVIGVSLRAMMNDDPLAAREVLKDAVGGVVGGGAGRAIRLASRVGWPFVTFIARWGKGATLGVLGVTAAHLTDAATGVPFNREQYLRQARIGAIVGFAMDLAGESVAALARWVSGKSSYTERIAWISKRIDQLNNQLPENYRHKHLFGKMWEKMQELDALENELASQTVNQWVLDHLADIRNSGFAAVVDDIARKIATMGDR